MHFYMDQAKVELSDYLNLLMDFNVILTLLLNFV